MNKKIAIIGGGPTGIGAAYHLNKLGYKNWVLYEKNDYLGGRSSTHVDSKGFLWDEGGHVLFSHFQYFDDFILESLGNDFYRHQRECWIKIQNEWVPYPFQNNIRYLSSDDQLKCVLGLIKTRTKKKARISNFKEWVLSVFGEGIAEIFMLPYNFKVWATPANLMAKEWIGERVSVVDLERVLSNIIKKKDDVSWGPNNTFIFPKYGGTRAIYEGAAKKFHQHIQLSKELIFVDLKNKKLYFKDGSSDAYDFLISAMPINELIKISKNVPLIVRRNVEGLLSNNIIVVGLGFQTKIETSKCWAYFPDKKTPFYRLTFFHNYSPFVVPDGDTEKYSSLMCEISYSQFKKVNKKTVAQECIRALSDHGIIKKEDESKVVSVAQYDIPYGYPIPTLDRDKRLNVVQSYLLKNKVYSRGRYGAWKYEIANMDHSFMQGVEAVDSILKKKKETIWTL